MRLAGALLVAVGLVGCSDDDLDSSASTSTTSPIAEEIAADFDWDYDLEQTSGTACSFSTTHFFDRSSGEPTSWLWEFPDGSSSEEPNPTVDSARTRVSGDGTVNMSVRLTVTRDGFSDFIEREVFPVHC